MSRNYILVTPCKNEAKNLPHLIKCMVTQTVCPVAWIIVDDGSDDDSPQIIRKAAEKYNWIQNINLNKKNKRDLGLHLATVLNLGFDYAVSYCNQNNLNYEYLANVDGDLTLDSTFFEKLMNEFENDPHLGVASGGTKHIIGNRIIYAKVSPDEPSGGHMLIRRECFEECGGIPISYAMDSALKAKARLKGWKTKRFETSVATEIRDVGSAEGYWKGYIHNGNCDYFLNYHPLHVIIKSTFFLFRRPYYIGVAYLLGYFSNFIMRNKQIDDIDIKTYFWNKWKYIYKKRLQEKANL